MGTIDVASDALGRALLDHLAGVKGSPLILESDDGSVREADLQPADFFSLRERWPQWERHAIARVTGSVLDLGAGAGRHSLYLQELGHPVTVVDVSPGCVEVSLLFTVTDAARRNCDTCSGPVAGPPLFPQPSFH